MVKARGQRGPFVWKGVGRLPSVIPAPELPRLGPPRHPFAIPAPSYPSFPRRRESIPSPILLRQGTVRIPATMPLYTFPAVGERSPYGWPWSSGRWSCHVGFLDSRLRGNDEKWGREDDG